MKVRSTLAAAFLLGAAFASAQVTNITGGPGSVGHSAFSQVHAPFSADVAAEQNQVLADGNRIHREWQEKLYRDSQGRMRTEREAPARAGANGDPALSWMVSIHDPIERVTIFLDTRLRIATVHHDLRGTRPPAPVQKAVPDPLPAVPHSQPRVRNLDGASTRTDSNGRIIKTEKLGTKDIDGLTAIGTRTTTTIEAGVDGNSEPIVIVRETWFSPELTTDLLTNNNDPRSGDTTRKLENIQRAEPDPSLFQIPPDYTVKDETVVKESAENPAAAEPAAK
jgi:hypothetical protein